MKRVLGGLLAAVGMTILVCPTTVLAATPAAFVKTHDPNASVEWPVQDSQYRTVVTIRLPRQNAYSPEQVRIFDEAMTFRPAHSLAAHRPLGSVTRARLQVYQALSVLRHRENGVAEANTSSIEEIPA